jgi:uncharacterized protein (TIGR00255 family)
MTGFARVEIAQERFSVLGEAKSVNGKGLELRFRLPASYDAAELPLRASFGEKLKRGNVSVSISVTRVAGGAQLRINHEALAQIVATLHELSAEVEAAPPRLDGILAMRGVLEAQEEGDTPELREAILATIREVGTKLADDLAAARLDEGRHLGEIITARLDEIERLTTEAEASAAAQPAAVKARLRELVTALLEAGAGIAEDRLAQEAAFLVGKADVREELDRLRAHVAAARALLAEGVAIGRRLDFLCQEFNREANTLCSKSADLELTRLGLALKASIEQLREQVQNVE